MDAADPDGGRDFCWLRRWPHPGPVTIPPNVEDAGLRGGGRTPITDAMLVVDANMMGDDLGQIEPDMSMPIIDASVLPPGDMNLFPNEGGRTGVVQSQAIRRDLRFSSPR